MKMTIREAEQRTGLDRATIRFYEKGVYTITVQSSKSGTTDTYIYSKDFNISETAN